MSPDNVFRKTQKGRDEIEKRTLRIDAKRRTLLILVDGRASAGELADKLAHIPDSLALLQSLWSEGFVEPAGALAADEPAGAGVPEAARAGAADLDQLKRRATREIERLMGPDGDSIAIRIERAGTHAAFVAEATRARDAIRAFLGPRQADEFWKSLQP
jgi:hypothetical protein